MDPDAEDGVVSDDVEEFEQPATSTGSPGPFTNLVAYVIFFVQTNPWLVFFAVVGLYYVFVKYVRPRLEQLQFQREESVSKKTDSAQFVAREEGRMKHLAKLQEEIDLKAAVIREQQTESEQRKRQQKIEDWEKHEKGEGYRNKMHLNEGSSSTQSAAVNKTTKKKPINDNYNPLMGFGGGGYRPSPRSGFSGGGG